MASKELATLDNQLAEIEKVAAECNLDSIASLGSFKRAFALSRGIQQLRAMISDDMMSDVMSLMNTSLGFRTDRDPQTSPGTEPYGIEVVRECLIEASLRGLQPVGNQFNIISGRCYVTKEGFSHKLRELPGFAGLKMNFGVPRLTQGGAIVECSATWQLDGKKSSITAEIPVRMNKGMGADAVLGKAERKLKARIFAQITGSEQPEGEADEPNVDTMRRVNVSSDKGNEAVKAKLGDLFGNGADEHEVQP